jgi:hypothetical protein
LQTSIVATVDFFSKEAMKRGSDEAGKRRSEEAMTFLKKYGILDITGKWQDTKI